MRRALTHFLLVLFMASTLPSCRKDGNQIPETESASEQVESTADTPENQAENVTDELQQRYEEDNLRYAELALYDGEYLLYTESEGVDATLALTYLNDRSFTFNWIYKVDVEEAQCQGHYADTLFMDRTQHGFAQMGDCRLQFEFNGLWNGYYVVELTFENPDQCDLNGECTFSGTYQKMAQ